MKTWLLIKLQLPFGSCCARCPTCRVRCHCWPSTAPQSFHKKLSWDVRQRRRLIYQFFLDFDQKSQEKISRRIFYDWNAIISINNSWPKSQKTKLFISNSHKRPTNAHTANWRARQKNVKMIYQPRTTDRRRVSRLRAIWLRNRNKLKRKMKL